MLYYAGTIFDDAGIGTIASVFVGVFKLIATLVAVVSVDGYGRRKLLFAGVGLMAVSLAGLTCAFYGFDGSGGLTPQKSPAV